MTERTAAIVRAFDGSPADAEGLLAVERASFDESPYSPQEVMTMLTAGPQRAWLAIAGSVVVGFVIAFATTGLRGPMWEIDLLAVRPSWRGRGLATRLVRASSAHGTRLAGRARSVVAVGNHASTRVFRRAGFRKAGETRRLVIYRVQGEWQLSPRQAGRQ